MRGRILVVDDEPLKRITLQIELAEQGYEVYEAADARTARRILDSEPIDVVVSDVRMPGMSGLDLLAHVRQNKPAVDVILMTAYATVDTAVLAMKRGAYDYITKPFTTQDLLVKLDGLFAVREPVQVQEELDRFGDLLARSASMRRIFEQARSVAQNDRCVLLCGEAGVGKDALAQAIHENSARRDGPFVRFSCASGAGSELNAQLFGRAAVEDDGEGPESGWLERAGRGTLLIDEIESLPHEAQVNLLRIAEHGDCECAGRDRPVKVDVRLIGMSRCDLLGRVRDGSFREDLFYRLSSPCIDVPPLRERPDDIPLLARHFIDKHASMMEVPPAPLSARAIDELLRYAWPGNVRELEHVIERALAFCRGEEIRPEHVLPLERASDVSAPHAPELSELTGSSLAETVADIERRMILMALKQANGNQVRAAQKLGIPRTTLRDKMARYSIPVS